MNRAAREMGMKPGAPLEQWRESHGARGSDGKLIDGRDTLLRRALEGETSSAVIEHQLPSGAVRSLSKSATRSCLGGAWPCWAICMAPSASRT